MRGCRCVVPRIPQALIAGGLSYVAVVPPVHPPPRALIRVMLDNTILDRCTTMATTALVSGSFAEKGHHLQARNDGKPISMVVVALVQACHT